MKYDWSKEKLEQVIPESDSLSDVLSKLQIPIQGNNSQTLKSKIEEYGIDISHFTYGAKKKKGENYIPVSEYLFNGSSIHTAKLKTKLLKEGIKENKCECCGISEWMGKPIVIQLHHIDGNNCNNELSNLQMLCPNCHSQTDNYCGSANEKKKYYCPECGKEIKRGSTYCVECANKHRRKVDRPELEQLLEDYKKLKAFTKIGKLYNVTDNTVRKWFKYYGLPHSAKELKEYINNN